MAWSVLQSAKGTGVGVTTLTVTYSTANVSSGNKLVSHIAIAPAVLGSISSVQDAALNSETSCAAPSGSTGGNYHGALYAMDVPAGDAGTKPAIKVTYSQTADIAMLVQEASGLATGNTTAAMLDGTAATSQITPSTSQAQPSYSSTASGELLYSVLGDNGNSVTWTVPSGYTADSNNVNGSVNDDLLVSWKNSTGGAESGTWTTSGTPTGSGLIVVAFKLAAGGGAPSMPPGAARRVPYRTAGLPPVRRYRSLLPVPAQFNPPYPFSELAQRRQAWSRGLPRRGRVTFAVPLQLNPPYPFAEVTQRRQEWPRGLPRRGRAVSPVPEQPYPFAEVAQRRQAHPRALLRRGRLVTPVPAQLNPPYPFAGLRQWRQLRGLLPRRGHGFAPVPAQDYPVAEARQQRQPRGFFPRRGHGFAPVPAQQAAAPNPAITFQQPKHLRMLFQRRGRVASPVPAQQAAPVNPAITFQPLRHPRLALAPRRGRPLPPVPGQDAPAFQAQRHPRLALQRRGRVTWPPQPPPVPPAWVQGHRSPLRAIALIRRRFAQLIPWPQAVAPAFSVGKLTAADAPLNILDPAASAATGLATLTATDQRTGGPS